MVKIIIFGFSNNISSEIVRRVKVDNSLKFYLNSADEFSFILDSIKKINPQYILGLGEYSGKDKQFLKVEQFCSNKFRNSPTSPQKIKINHFLESNKDFKLSNSIGNSFCNLISFKIMTLKSRTSKYTFLHIPKDYSVNLAVKILEGKLSFL